MRQILIPLMLILLPLILRAERLLVLPPAGDASKIEDVKTIQLLFEESLQRFYTGVILTDSATGCDMRACAIEQAKQKGADKVVYTVYRRLGGRWIIVATLVRADGEEACSRRGSAERIEDFEPLMDRFADALINRKTMDEAASVENITEFEREKEPNRRTGIYSGGLSVGYLYPVNRSFSHYEGETFQYNSATGGWEDKPRLVTHSQYVKLGWINSWELKSNLAVNLEFVWHAPTAFGGDINGIYLSNNKDFTPFVGGGLGIHYVVADKGDKVNEDKLNSGPSLNAQAGILLFRTYNVNLMLRTQYRVIFNSDIDHGPSWDMSILYHQRQKAGEEEGEPRSIGSSVKYYALFGLVGIIICAMVD